MAVTRAFKEEELQQLEQSFKGTDSAIVVDYKGLKVPEVTGYANQDFRFIPGVTTPPPPAKK